MIRQAVEVKVKTAIWVLVLKYLLPIILFIGLLFGSAFMVLMMADQLFGGKNNTLEEGTANVSQNVLKHKATVEKYAKEYEVSEYVSVLLAIMMQESGGKGDDPMQASESLCGSVGCIKDTEKSIEQGVKYFSAMLKEAEGDLKTTIQSYNFGSGFIDYVNQNGGQYTKELAIAFSQQQYQKLAHTGLYSCVRPESLAEQACYGDIGYVDAVLQYYDYTLPASGKGDWSSPIKGLKNVTSGFGWRTWSDGSKENHKGIDFGCINHVTPIHAASEGKVVYSGFHKNKNGAAGYGNLVILKHGDNLYSGYAHLSEANVRKGESIKSGQNIGVCGSTGNSTGPHLHFEIKESKWSNHLNPHTLLGL
ncbi:MULTISPECIES: lysozyme family protein [Fictibacillus]|uniref:lysozyme family protein n=1 Tax=Fictibacillus TaxID=1329200 RepID=UPI0018CD5279|nr:MULTISPECIES: lysozyme family protein [unclassified Fictibacillus]MBH0157136.1 lysozyme family protein [Fictibacillus sp. 5RED26]MBH0159458.1 lysozyme family protein [Fictibacillus sp. 26RED30]MBH0163744.1 lysozyme family protein [Fictibacillus sp. 7GRE50]MBH0169631.1 lysozyme family protein [Fictibacillus sp. 18YEL24]MBH0174130.1 lysozyme family protein [Fictibacillus sp. 23RED33]